MSISFCVFKESFLSELSSTSPFPLEWNTGAFLCKNIWFFVFFSNWFYNFLDFLEILENSDSLEIGRLELLSNDGEAGISSIFY